MKDSVAIAGIPLTCGSAILQGFVPRYDATVTDRILRAGGEIVCITNMDDLAFSGGGESSWYGPTRNPFDPERSAGGSSSGSAAALWYEGIDLAVGCDQGGSIRAPASWCGLVGLKPTHSLVPYTGIAGIDQTLDHCGPLARTTAGAALLLQAIAGFDPAIHASATCPRPTTSGRSSARAAISGSPHRRRRGGLLRERGRRARDLRGRARGRRAARRPGRRRAAGVVPPAPRGGRRGVRRLRRGHDRADERRRQRLRLVRPLLGELAPAILAGMRERADELSPQVKAALAAGSHLRDRLGGAPYARRRTCAPGCGRPTTARSPTPTSCCSRPRRSAPSAWTTNCAPASASCAAGRTSRTPIRRTCPGIPRSRSPWPRRTACPSA